MNNEVTPAKKNLFDQRSITDSAISTEVYASQFNQLPNYSINILTYATCEHFFSCQENVESDKKHHVHEKTAKLIYQTQTKALDIEKDRK